MKTQFQIAQVNIGRIRAPLDDPQMAGFVANLEGINGLADSRPGFVWRLKTDAGDATALRPYDDDRILVNLSVWANPQEEREPLPDSGFSPPRRKFRPSAAGNIVRLECDSTRSM